MVGSKASIWISAVYVIFILSFFGFCQQNLNFELLILRELNFTPGNESASRVEDSIPKNEYSSF